MALPAKSLGHRYATWFENASGKPLPDPVLAPGTDGDDTWLQQQVRRTHHEWPVVSGCPPSPAGARQTAHHGGFAAFSHGVGFKPGGGGIAKTAHQKPLRSSPKNPVTP